MFCITLNPQDFKAIKTLNYIPVGLGDKNFSKDWLTDKQGNNISKKNPFYGEYTFHYWLWKNHLDKINNEWIGFCQYRKFWINNKILDKNIDFSLFEKSIVKFIPDEYLNSESIIGEKIFTNEFRFSKFVKNNFKTMFLSPSLFFNKNKRNIKFQFNMMHGNGNLDKAIDLLSQDDKIDFRNFINTEVSFNPHNMFICKSKKILIRYYETLFPWLEKCEKIFGFDDLSGYGLKRIYGFLAERFMSYWFQKNTKAEVMPILFNDISKYKL